MARRLVTYPAGMGGVAPWYGIGDRPFDRAKILSDQFNLFIERSILVRQLRKRGIFGGAHTGPRILSGVYVLDIGVTRYSTRGVIV
jgi:hypothetical protein